MKRASLLLALSLLSTLPAAPAGAYVLSTHEFGGKPAHPRWPSALLPIPFVVNDRPLELLPNLTRTSAPLAAVDAALKTWSIAPVGLYLDGTASTAGVANDGVNLITLANTAQNRELVGNLPWRTYTWEQRKGDQSQIVEADLVFNPKAAFATDGTAGAFDVRAVLTHELGHVLGLDESPIAAAAMYSFAGERLNLSATLHSDDIAGLRAIYGLPGADLGGIAGQVLTGEDKPIFGAHVVAVDRDGAVTVGALSDRDGSFTLTSLTPGDYQVYAEPLDGPVLTTHLHGEYFRNARFPLQRSFRTAFAGGDTPSVIHVGTSETISLNPIRVEARPPTLNPRFVAWSKDGKTFRPADQEPLQIEAGNSALLVVIGEGLNGVSRKGFSVSGSDISLDTAHLVRGTANGGTLPFAIMSLTVRKEARPGARSLYVASDTERAADTGCLEVVGS